MARAPPNTAARAWGSFCLPVQEAAAKKEAEKKEEAPKEEAKAEAKPAVAISAAVVKQLREKSGAGMMDCKKALAECNGDVEAASEVRRHEGGHVKSCQCWLAALGPVLPFHMGCLAAGQARPLRLCPAAQAAGHGKLLHCVVAHQLTNPGQKGPHSRQLAPSRPPRLQYLRKKGLASADKKAGRVAAEGAIGAYIHAGSR